jgi:hypothetical protein
VNGTRILYLVLLVAGVVLIAVGVAWPLVGRGPRLNRDLRSMTEELNSLNQRLEQYQAQQREYEELVRLFGPPLTDLSTRMPRFVSQIQGLCSTAQVTVISLQPLAREESPEGWVRFPIQLTVRGDRYGLVKLLYRLRNHVPLTEVERLIVRADPKNRKDLTIQMLLSSYGLLSEEALAERRKKEESSAPRTAER